MDKPVLVVLAAGMGSRYGGLKQMDSMGPCGQGILDYSCYDARRAGFERVIFVIKHEIEADFKSLVGKRVARGMAVDYAYQELTDLPMGYAVPAGRKKPWGTAHATLAARELIRGPFAVVNCDDYYGPASFRLIYDFLSAHSGEAGRYAMIGYHLGNTVTDKGSVARGVCKVGSDGLLEEVVEHTNIEKTPGGGRSSLDGGKTWTDLPGDTLVSMNFWGFQREFMDRAWERFPSFLDRTLRENPEKGEYFLPLAVTPLLREGAATMEVLPCREQWYGVTYREDRPSVVSALERKTREGLYPENLWG